MFICRFYLGCAILFRLFAEIKLGATVEHFSCNGEFKATSRTEHINKYFIARVS